MVAREVALFACVPKALYSIYLEYVPLPIDNANEWNTITI